MALGTCGVAGAVSVASFILMYPATEGFREQAIRVLSNQNAQIIVASMSLVVGALLLISREYLALATLAVVVALAEVEVQNFWWHGLMVLFVPLTIGLRSARTPPQAETGSIQSSLPTMMRAGALLWCFAIHPVVWRDHPGEVFTEFVKFFRI
jgi:hypothetical protein